ncbi:hypothetical protein [Aurantimonas endophytica]|uniref:Uncharacterized protein n=1 Tax=Aurantimonas endophytica TaxID=1522175 RepID=A0A7W6HCW5_9HYPH|nr:hypothetical protein [Aurantimonas endophytica]MBB4002653.1 hypothetical protein [Aurantimonas endophytica]MCO6403533.1 hypothetical protein [Aurantimonas endophytica]
MAKKPPKDEEMTLERLEDLMLKAADLVDMFDEEMRPLLDYWERHYLARVKRIVMPERKRIEALITQKRREIEEAQRPVP